jgi:hypothetical protein
MITTVAALFWICNRLCGIGTPLWYGAVTLGLVCGVTGDALFCLGRRLQYRGEWGDLAIALSVLVG